MEDTHFILIRHGETTANLSDTVGGSTDDPLTETGHEQARRVGEHLKANGCTPTAIYVSPLQRARDTAAYIAATLMHTPETIDHLTEWHVGDWEGIKYSEIPNQEGFSMSAMFDPAFRPPDGESLGEVQMRMMKTIRDLATRHPGEQVVIVSHGTALALALSEMVDQSMASWVNYRLANCSISEVIFGEEPKLLYFNAIEHL